MDPRVERTHRAVMHAATELLLDGGPTALTMDGVVARSGVAKSTLYRHWATRDDLVADVLRSCAPEIPPIPADAGFVDALRHLVDGLMVSLGDQHWNRVLPSLLMLKNELGAAADVDELVREHQHDVAEQVLRRGVDEGALPTSVLDEVDLVVTLLVGPLVLAGLTGSIPLDATLRDRVIEQFLAGQQRRGGR